MKVLPLPNNRLVSCTLDCTIKVWKSDPPYSDTPLKTLFLSNPFYTSLLYIKERDLLVSGSFDIYLRFWNMSTYQCVSSIYPVSCRYTNCLYQIDSERIIVGFDKMFYVVNMDTCTIEKWVKVKKELGGILCFEKLKDNKTIVCGCQNGAFLFYDKETHDIRIQPGNHQSGIVDLCALNENTMVSCSKDGTLKVWDVSFN